VDSSRVVVVIEHNGVRSTAVCESAADWRGICEALRVRLQADTRSNRCASAVVSVHFEDERCDHER